MHSPYLESSADALICEADSDYEQNLVVEHTGGARHARLRRQLCKLKEAIKGCSGALGAAAMKEVCVLSFGHLHKRDGCKLVTKVMGSGREGCEDQACGGALGWRGIRRGLC